LWEMSWRWVEIAAFPAEPIAQAAAPTRAQFEADMLRLMRGADVQAAATRLSDLCARMAAHLSDIPSRTLWQLASAFYEGLAADRIARDVYSKRLSSRLLAQFGRGQKGEGAVSERLG